MKIAVFGYPRTGSTKLCYILQQVYNTPFIGEVLTRQQNNEYHIIKQINNQSNIIVKFFSYQFISVPVTLVHWDTFDVVYFTYRESIVDAFISQQIAMRRNQWIPGINPFLINDPFVVDCSTFENYCKTHIISYNKIQKVIANLTMRTEILSYNDISNDTFYTPIDELPIRPTNINYREKCLNYQEVEWCYTQILCNLPSIAL